VTVSFSLPTSFKFWFKKKKQRVLLLVLDFCGDGNLSSPSSLLMGAFAFLVRGSLLWVSVSWDRGNKYEWVFNPYLEFAGRLSFKLS